MPPRSQPTCPRCGADLARGTPQGLCLRCVLQQVATAIEEERTLSANATAPSLRKHPGGARWSAAEISGHFQDLEVLELVGVGGMGAAYKARQRSLDRIVALKILSSELASDPAFIERFSREARLLARLNHPNIVTVFQAGSVGPFAYLIMEYVEGENLRHAIQSGRFGPEEALLLARNICEPLQFAHEQGILHRDIKPENILINARGEVKIADFGIAKLVGATEPGMVTLTRENSMLGSPRYMSPEQLETPGDVDQRADIYSLGLVLYELLTGRLPMGKFEPPSSRTAVDARVDEILMQALERDRATRFQTVDELKARLQELIESKSPANLAVGNPLATRAAVCTGASLALALVAAAYFQIMLEQNRNNAVRDSTLYMILAVELVVVGIPAVLGMLFGWRVLAELRGRRGSKPGFDTALCGALPWPLILGLVMVAGTIWAITDAIGVSLPMPLFVMISLLLGGMLAAKLTLKVVRWVEPPGVSSPSS